MFVRKTNFLGSGEFATVNKGVWRGSKGMVDVAVKTLSESATEAEKIRFLQEAVIMGQFVHPNIVQLYGIVTRGEPVSAKPCYSIPSLPPPPLPAQNYHMQSCECILVYEPCLQYRIIRLLLMWKIAKV